MNHPRAILGLLAVFFGTLSSSVNAQVNLKTGYNISFFRDDGFDQLIQAVNTMPEYADHFRKLRWLHGFEAGLRFKRGPHALEFTYLGGYQKLRAAGSTIPDNVDFKDKINIAVNETGLGYQLSGELFGIGGEVHYQWIRTRADITTKGSSFKYVQGLFGYEAYILATLRGSGNIDMAIKPFYIFPSETYDLDPLQTYLQVDKNIAESKWRRFGISILFYNGNK